ncbi:MAG: hypothetical protein KGI06_00135 [Candidatus Micrarchaeota archaeon]|nr:hypothetical protein [Candidatus Micrarchaeota archaeon]
MDKLSVKGLALGIGIPWALCVLVAGLVSPFWASGFVQVFSTVYPGYGSGLVSGIIGGIEAFFDGAVAGALIALIYNWTGAKKGARK